MTVAPAVADAEAPPETGWRPPRLVMLATFVAFVLLGLAWTFASPLYAGPDEPDHVVRAASFVRGEWQGFTAPDEAGNPSGAVRAPHGMVSRRGWYLCFAHRNDVPAGCQHLRQPDDRMVVAHSGAARYYPPYYAVDGLPSLVSPGPTGVYLMRVLSMLLCAALLALAVSTVTVFASPVALAGCLIAVTPMVVFVSSVVNPSGIEIAGGVVCWVAGAALARGAGGDGATGRLVRRFGTAALAMLLVRATAPIWLLVGVLLLAAGAGWPRVRALARRRDVRIWSGVLVVAAAVNAYWTAGPGALDPVVDPRRVTFVEALQESLRRWPWRNEQLIGVFGWLDVRPPVLTYVIWGVALVTLLVAAVRCASWRWRGVLAGVVVVALGLPVLLEAVQANRYGFPWQGRYTLPFAVGIPVVAGALGAAVAVPHRWRLRAVVGGAAALAVGHLLAIGANALRYQHGGGHGHNIFTGSWMPPGGAWPMILLAVAGAAALVAAAALTERHFGTVDQVSVSS